MHLYEDVSLIRGGRYYYLLTLLYLKIKSLFIKYLFSMGKLWNRIQYKYTRGIVCEWTVFKKCGAIDCGIRLLFQGRLDSEV